MAEATFISAAHPSQGGPATYFRRSFDVADGLVRASLRVTALGVFKAYLNGSRLGEDVLAPTWTSYRHRLHVTTHDVTAALAAGENVLGAAVGEGWAVGPLSWDMVRENYSDRPALYAELTLEYPDRTEIVGSDETFLVGEGPVRENGIYLGEHYDARLESAWSEPGFDTRDWAPAQRLEWDLDALVEGEVPPIRRQQELAPVSIDRREPSRVIVDFGQVVSGWVRFTVKGEAGREIVLRHAELLTSDGELERETLRKAESIDTYVLRGGRSETWEPAFTFHGFRYVEISGWPGELDPDALRAIVIHTEMARTGSFDTSHALLNRLHENTVWSMRGNFVGLPTDCPQRDERLGWTGDLNAFAPTASYLYDVRPLLRSWLADLRAEQAETGRVPDTVPNILTQVMPDPTALWSDAAISLPWQLYQQYGDERILDESYASMVALMDQIEQRLDDGGLWSRGFQLGDWLDPDAPADNPAGGKTEAHLVAQAYLCKTTRELAATARILGHRADADRYDALSERVRRAFREEYVSPRGRVTNESATAYALAIVFDILDDDQLAHAGNRLAAIIAKSKFTIRTGFAGTPLVTDALTKTGHIDPAYRLLLQTTCPSFLYPVTQGATTIWERWDSVLPDGTVNKTGMTSLNHYALGAVADWMHREIAGLQRVAPGWSRIRIAPQPGGGLAHARAELETVRGTASSAWRLDGATLTVEAVIPEGSTAEIALPFTGESHEVEAGTHRWTYEIDPADAARGTLTIDSTLNEIVVDHEAWQRVLAVLQGAMPGIPIEAGLAHIGDQPLSALIAQIPAEGIAARITTALQNGES